MKLQIPAGYRGVIFPIRKIGRLADGADANFLVLGGNPLDEIANVETAVRPVLNP